MPPSLPIGKSLPESSAIPKKQSSKPETWGFGNLRSFRSDKTNRANKQKFLMRDFYLSCFYLMTTTPAPPFFLFSYFFTPYIIIIIIVIIVPVLAFVYSIQFRTGI